MKEFGMCKNCKFWNTEDDTELEGVRTCSAAMELWKASEWDDDYEGMALLEEHKDKGSFVQDADDYSAELVTQGTFGCNEFKGKD